MIGYVQQGQKVTASLTNQLIDAANGILEPSEGEFTKTPRGAVFGSNAKLSMSSQMKPSFLVSQTRLRTDFKLISRDPDQRETSGDKVTTFEILAKSFNPKVSFFGAGEGELSSENGYQFQPADEGWIGSENTEAYQFIGQDKELTSQWIDTQVDVQQSKYLVWALADDMPADEEAEQKQHTYVFFLLGMNQMPSKGDELLDLYSQVRQPLGEYDTVAFGCAAAADVDDSTKNVTKFSSHIIPEVITDIATAQYEFLADDNAGMQQTSLAESGEAWFSSVEKYWSKDNKGQPIEVVGLYGFKSQAAADEATDEQISAGDVMLRLQVEDSKEMSAELSDGTVSSWTVTETFFQNDYVKLSSVIQHSDTSVSSDTSDPSQSIETFKTNKSGQPAKIGFRLHNFTSERDKELKLEVAKDIEKQALVLSSPEGYGFLTRDADKATTLKTLGYKSIVAEISLSDLASVDIPLPDADVESLQQKSVDLLSSAETSSSYYQLHNFDNTSSSSYVISFSLNTADSSSSNDTSVDFLTRSKGSDGALELGYSTISVSSNVWTDVDFWKFIELRDIREGSIELMPPNETIDNQQIIQLKDFSLLSQQSRGTYEVSAALDSATESIVFQYDDSVDEKQLLMRDVTTSEVVPDLKYVNPKFILPLSLLPSSGNAIGDADAVGQSKSIQSMEISSGLSCLRLYDFDKDADAARLSVTLADIGNGIVDSPEVGDLVMRKDNQVKYSKPGVVSLIGTDALTLGDSGRSIDCTEYQNGIQCIGISRWNSQAFDGVLMLSADPLAAHNWLAGGTVLDLDYGNNNARFLQQDSGMKYRSLYCRLPPIPKADQMSIERNYSGSDAYDGLYGFTSQAADDLTVAISPGGTVPVTNGFEVIARQGTQLAYKHISLSCPDISAASQQEINVINNNITVISSDISILSNEIDGLSNRYWKLDGDQSNCYGSAIGDSAHVRVINLNTRELDGPWTATANFTANILDVLGPITSQYGQLTLGNTSVNEEQLKKLLALIS